MTPGEWSLVISGVATGVAVASYIRVLLQELPSVEFLVTRDRSDEEQFWLSVSNPSRRLIILDWVEVISPPMKKVETVIFQAVTEKDSIKGDLNRGFDEAERTKRLGSHRMKPVFLAVPAGENQLLSITFKDVEEDENGGFKVNFHLHWSKGPWWTYLIRGTRRITLDAGEVKARKMASFNHPSLAPEL